MKCAESNGHKFPLLSWAHVDVIGDNVVPIITSLLRVINRGLAFFIINDIAVNTELLVWFSMVLP
jgi:hypothetical protein